MLGVERALAQEASNITPVLMSFKVYGERPAGKSPLILIHGLFNKKKQWDNVAKIMATATGSDVIAVDLRNHGDSPWTDGFSQKHISADIHHLITHVGAQQAHVLGHGYGGRTVVQLALEKPAILKSIIVSESTPFGVPPGYWRLASILRTLKDVPITQGDSIEVVRKELDRSLKPKIRSPIMRKLFLTNVQAKPNGQITWHFNLNSLLNNMDKACRIPNLTPTSVSQLPALFVCGEASDSLPKYHLSSIMTLFPKATVAYAGGAGYRIFHDRPAFFAEFVSEFVNKH